MQKNPHICPFGKNSIWVPTPQQAISDHRPARESAQSGLESLPIQLKGCSWFLSLPSPNTVEELGFGITSGGMILTLHAAEVDSGKERRFESV